MIDLRSVKQAPGVYLMLDLDEHPVYAGQSGNVRKRLRKHLIYQNSDVVADGRLDLYEVRSVLIWYRTEDSTLPLDFDDSQILQHPLDVLEAAVCRQFNPRWNRSVPTWSGPIPSLSLSSPHQRIEVLESEALDLHRRRAERMENRLWHMLRALRNARVSGASARVFEALYLHARDLAELSKGELELRQLRLEKPLMD
jgi:hypothetical protein